ncbi:MAG TPA: tetratricopeptide repeat protein, partial [Blastocatellia bacterium]|nr:tetratricopeptide repeat protein [Blastocatellia bacterium]
MMNQACHNLFFLLRLFVAVAAQVPPSIQFFLPGGALPNREIRFTLERDDGRIEILFTDTRGKFQLTGGLVAEGQYTITVNGDGRSFDTTTHRFQIVRTISYIPVFLRPLKTAAPPPKEVVDAADANVPDEARRAYEAGLQAMNEGQAETSLVEFQRALKLHPNYLRALNDQGVLFFKLNRLDEAAASFRQAIAVNPRFYAARLNFGRMLNRQGKFKEAAETLNQLAKENASLSGLQVAQAEALTGLGALSEARKLLLAALKQSDLSLQTKGELHFKLGVLLNREEKFDEAEKELEQAVTLDPTAANAHLQLGGAYLQGKKFAEAER